MNAADTEWGLRAACHNHPVPDMWFPDHGTGPEARRICVEECPVRRACGEAAIARGEKFAIAAGFRCSDPMQRTALRRWLGLPVTAQKGVPCTRCGQLFQGKKRQLCPDCKGLTDVTPVRQHVHTLHFDEGMAITRIASLADVAATTVRAVLFGVAGSTWQNMDKERAQRLLAVQPPARSRVAS
ncbi:WhiB family transcriptional regulator [Nocardia sp. NPDC049149]|uniref:WhiB family transcriptional regulator n=1 Tax=Nocardia sp. NPDC049149 TaxID=3364315 RepID=UPI00371081C8